MQDMEMPVTPSLPRRPSRWWVTAAVATATIGVIAVSGAYLMQRDASRPVGEGRLFLEDARRAAVYVSEAVAASESLDATVRHVRNALSVEAAAIVDSEGAVMAATSASMMDSGIINGLLGFGLANGRMAAMAAGAPVDIAMDGITEWTQGDVLYQVVYPLADEGGIVLYYDISELLERRTQSVGVDHRSLRLAVTGTILVIIAIALLIGRSRVMSRYREIHREASLLKEHAAELEATNRDLDIAREQAEQALALAEEKMRVRAEFVLMINHELRTPLTSVVTGAEMLHSEGHLLSDEDRNQILDDIVCDGVRLQNIIAQMLSVARIENRGLDFQLRSVPLLETCAAIERSHPRVTIGHAEGVDESVVAALMVRTDPVVLGNLIASLSDNAFSHGAGHVVVTCRPDPGFIPILQVGSLPKDAVYFTVADDGPGIDPDFLPQAFEKFEKRSFSSGTGLGLYIARLIVEALDGAIAVTTSPEGTTMAVAVPLAPAMAESAAA